MLLKPKAIFGRYQFQASFSRSGQLLCQVTLLMCKNQLHVDSIQAQLDRWISKSNGRFVGEECAHTKGPIALRRTMISETPDFPISTLEKLRFCKICDEYTVWRTCLIKAKDGAENHWRCKQCQKKRLSWYRELRELMPYIGTRTMTDICEQCGNYGELQWTDGKSTCENCR